MIEHREEIYRIMTSHGFRGVNSFSFSQDGNFMAGQYSDGIKVSETKTGSLISTFLGDGSDNKIVFSPNGRYIISTRRLDSYYSEIWNLNCKYFKRLEGRNAIFSHNGEKIATVRGKNEVLIWDMNGNYLNSLNTLREGHENTMTSLVFTFDGNLITNCSSDDNTKIWDLKSGTISKSIGGFHSVLSHDGRILATAQFDETVRIWSTKQWTELERLDFPKKQKSYLYDNDSSDRDWNRVNNMKFSLDDKTLVISKRNEITSRNEITVWNIKYQGCVDDLRILITKLKTIEPNFVSLSRNCQTGHLRSQLDFSLDGTFLATSGSETNIWLIKDGTLVQTIKRSATKLAFSPDSKILAISSRKNERVSCYQYNGIEWVLAMKVPNFVSELATKERIEILKKDNLKKMNSEGIK